MQADIVRKIGVVPELAGDEKQREIKSAEKDIDDAKELVRMLLSGPVRNSASVCVYPLHHTFAHKSTMRTQVHQAHTNHNATSCTLFCLTDVFLAPCLPLTPSFLPLK